MAAATEEASLIVDTGERQAHAAPMLVCKAAKKKCKKIEDLEPCWNEACQHHTHATCCKLLLDFNNIPAEQRPAQEDDIYFCGKRCYNKWWKQEQEQSKLPAADKKQKYVTWEEDGSQQVLMDWITTADNYSKYCGSTENNGTSKVQYHRIVSELIAEKTDGQSQRSAKDVGNKIQKLEAQFRKASDWMSNTAAVGTSTGSSNAAISAADDSDIDEAELEQPQPQPPPTAPKTPTAKGNSNKRLSSSGNKNKKPPKTRKGADDAIIASLLDVDENDKENSFKALRKREVEAKEKEAAALQLKSGKEVELLNMQLQQQQQKHLIALLKSRKELQEVGYTEAELDGMLGPLPKKHN
ncbi:unknown protein [Seminavis robusta]|uniref:Uncharacterized protein n=1 Tax=Seminavis robusta TaxID=568900 RepID=A0A9N8HYU6_9STRA|nr:unknown protein [Seminavis robusta]|eukprot:Sro2648_g333640.1 n/a (354) ;mRNA; f:8332-9582